MRQVKDANRKIEKKYKIRDAGNDMYEIPFINQIEDSILYPH